MDNIQRLSVKELKEELKKRGAETSGRKEELLERLKSYIKLQIQPSAPATETEVLQFPSDSLFQDLGTSHKDKILTTNVHLMDYFVFRKSEIDGAPVSNYRSLCDAGYRLFIEKFVMYIKCCLGSSGVFISSCVKSEYTKHKTYGIKLMLGTSGEILGAECGCVAGAGPKASCKHIAAVSYALEHFSKSGVITCFETCTQSLQTFHQPPSKCLKPSSPMKVENLPLGQVYQESCREVRNVLGINQQGYQHYVESLIKSSRHKLTFLYGLKNEKGSAYGVVHDHYYGSDPCSLYAEELVVVSDEQRKEIEEKTKEQSTQVLWFKERKFRLTASNFGKICHSGAPKGLAKAIFQGNSYCSDNMRWGLEMEDLARQRYSEITDHVVKKMWSYYSSHKTLFGCIL
ncbi:uncharacterized protein [Periplaneta americana]|uniref:uncharacterized protein n=1 Tax=Periplaneta americana TaxID=6978 RepID=UPI0037E74C51